MKEFESFAQPISNSFNIEQNKKDFSKVRFRKRIAEIFKRNLIVFMNIKQIFGKLSVEELDYYNLENLQKSDNLKQY